MQTDNTMQLMQLMQRCMTLLEKDIFIDERIKTLRVLASTATMLVENLEFAVDEVK